MDIIKTIKCPLKQILIRKVKYKKFLNLINNSNDVYFFAHILFDHIYYIYLKIIKIYL